VGEQVPLLYNGPHSQGHSYDQFGNLPYREGWGGDNASYTATYTNNKRNALTYDAAGNMTFDGQTFTYDATGQAATASYPGYLLEQYYDGNGLRVSKIENGATTYYLRSSVLGGQVVAEINGKRCVATRLCLPGRAVGGGAAAERGLLGASGSGSEEKARYE
jgi:hypothetical protein